MIKLSALVAAIAIMAPLPAVAYTQEEADACTPDVFRLCQEAIPDVGRITTCMTAKHRQLSPACMTVFNRLRNEPGAAKKRATAQSRPLDIHPAKY